MTWRPSIFVVLLLAGCGGGGGADNSFYLRFEPLMNPGTSLFIGDVRPLVWKDRIFQTGGSGTMEMLESSTREVAQVADLVALGDTLFGLRSGQLVSSTDAVTFTVVPGQTGQTFSALGGGDGALVALRSKSVGVADLFITTDQGATWTLLQEVTAGFTSGTGGSVHVGYALDGKVYASVGVYDDSLGNVDFAGQSYEVTLATQAVRLVNSSKQELPPLVVPSFKSKEGMAFFVDANDTVDQQGDATNIKLVVNPSANPDLKAARRLRWARPVLPYDASSAVVILGVDSQGRLLAASDKIYRSVNPLKLDDERAQVLKGPGCDGRHSWTPDLRNDDRVSVSIENKTGKKVMLRQIDDQMRWQRMRELEVDEKVLVSSISNGASKENARLMVSDPADDTCLGVYVVSGAKESTITAR